MSDRDCSSNLHSEASGKGYVTSPYRPTACTSTGTYHEDAQTLVPYREAVPPVEESSAAQSIPPAQPGASP